MSITYKWWIHLQRPSHLSRRHMIAFSQLNPVLNKLYENNQEISAWNGFRDAYMHVRACTLEAPGQIIPQWSSLFLTMAAVFTANQEDMFKP